MLTPSLWPFVPVTASVTLLFFCWCFRSHRYPDPTLLRPPSCLLPASLPCFLLWISRIPAICCETQNCTWKKPHTSQPSPLGKDWWSEETLFINSLLSMCPKEGLEKELLSKLDKAGFRVSVFGSSKHSRSFLTRSLTANPPCVSTAGAGPAVRPFCQDGSW